MYYPCSENKGVISFAVTVKLICVFVFADCWSIDIFQDNRVHIGHKIEMRVVTLGLDDAGKTSILFKMKQNEFITTIPTIGKYYANSEKDCQTTDSVSLKKHAHAINRNLFGYENENFQLKYFDIYAPNFEEVEGAYWFGSVRAVVCSLSVCDA